MQGSLETLHVTVWKKWGQSEALLSFQGDYYILDMGLDQLLLHERLFVSHV